MAHDQTPGVTPENLLSDAPSPLDLDSESSLRDAASAFLASKQKPGGGGRYATESAYVLANWIQWADQRGATTVADVDGRLMHRYAEHLSRRVDARVSPETDADDGIAGSTATQYFARVRAYLDWLVKREADVLATNPAASDAITDALPNKDDGRDSSGQQFWDRTFREQFLRWADWRFETAADYEWMDPAVAARDRALVGVVAYSGVRGAELLREPRDARRNGLRWGDVDLASRTGSDPDQQSKAEVRGKDQKLEQVGIHPDGADRLRTWKRRAPNTGPEWPVFPTEHLPSLYDAARNAAGDPDAIEEELGPDTVHDILAREGGVPPSLTVAGGASILDRLAHESGLRVDGELPKLHGARRGLGSEIYRVDPGAAQRQLRHKSPETTRKAYADIETDETTADVARALERSRERDRDRARERTHDGARDTGSDRDTSSGQDTETDTSSPP